MDSNCKPPITDSPWFWVCIFSAFALFLFWWFGGKYGDRQAQLERRFQASDRVMNNAPVADRPETQVPGHVDMNRRRFVTPEDPLIPIWPLIVLLLSAIAVSGYKLFRQRQRYMSLTEL
jgi:hypothetical protein